MGIAKSFDQDRAGVGAHRAGMGACVGCALDDLALAKGRGRRPGDCQSPRARVPLVLCSGPSTGMAASFPSGCQVRPFRSSSRSASPPPASTRPASLATACEPASPRAPCRRVFRHSRSDRRPATPATPCSPGMSATASCSSTTQRGKSYKRCE